MPSITDIRHEIAKLADGSPLVVALPGGTTGIGSYIATALATTFAQNGSKLRVYIVGRNAARAESVMSSARAISPGSDWRFVKATDLALISEVDRCCAEIIRQETEAPFHGGPVRLDLLYMTYCVPILGERASHVISVYAGGFEDGTSPGEWPVGCPPDSIYGIKSIRKHTCFMKTFVFEELSEKYAGKLSLTHIFPGLVDGPGFLNPEMPAWFRYTWWLFKPLVRLFMTSTEECGQVMVYLGTPNFPAKGKSDIVNVTLSTKGEPGGGAYSVEQKADPPKAVLFEKVRKDDTAKKIWDHTMDTLDQIAEANASAI